MPGLGRRKKNAPVANGTGYGGDASRDKAARLQARKAAAQKDSQLALTNQKLLHESQKKLQDEPPDELLVSIMKEVMRNQVPSDWDKRRKLYEAVLECCRIVAEKHPAVLGDGEESLLAALCEFAEHAEMILKHEKSSGKNDTKLVHLILKVRDQALAASQQAVSKPEMSVMDQHEHYRQALRPLRFELVESLKGHTFAKYSKPTRLNTRKLFRELTTYKTSLPIEYGSSIFVRAVEERLDLLRAIITGPEDTPYANGCFVFDIWLCNYPTQPPKVKYLTTGCGKYRFNPNLYADGKVCLSLLGTWAGPGWTSGESTLLQVLVSIQSLILVNDPYFNEPGYQSSQGTPFGQKQSDIYNQKIKKYTTEAGILPFLTTPCPYPEFDEVVRRHFRNKHSILQKQLYRWYTADNSLQALYSRCLMQMDAHKKVRRPRPAPTSPVSIKTREVDGVIEIQDDEEDEEVVTLKPPAKKTKVVNEVSDGSSDGVVDLT